jgi:hypothetical protein
MFNRRLHPTPSGFVFGLAVIALWALIWIWFFAQLSGRRSAAGKVVAEARLQRSAAHASDGRALRPLGSRSSRHPRA